jgi:hypothetical protein
MASEDDGDPCRREYKRMIYGFLVLVFSLLSLKFIKLEWFGGNDILLYVTITIISLIGIGATFPIAKYYLCLISYNKTDSL